jgi:fibronectin type 3 domain-containing protein
VYAAPINGVPLAGNQHTDTAVEMGQNLCYVVRMVLSTDPLVESEPSTEACVGVKDIAAPAAPTGVTALVQADHVEVSWSPSSEVDLKTYKVYRTAGGEKPALVGQVAAGETVFRDRTPGKGGAHFYTVTAVDAAGNESPPSSPAEGHLP